MRIGLLALLVGVMVLGGSAFAAPATHAAGKAQTTTEHLHQETSVFYDYVPCMEELGAYRITVIINAVQHSTEKDGTGHFTNTETGRFEAVGVDAILEYDEETDQQVPAPPDPPVDPSKPTFTGHYTVHGSFSGTQDDGIETVTFAVHGTGSDGSVINFHSVLHVSVEQSVVDKMFEKVRCN